MRRARPPRDRPGGSRGINDPPPRRATCARVTRLQLHFVPRAVEERRPRSQDRHRPFAKCPSPAVSPDRPGLTARRARPCPRTRVRAPGRPRRVSCSCSVRGPRALGASPAAAAAPASGPAVRRPDPHRRSSSTDPRPRCCFGAQTPAGPSHGHPRAPHRLRVPRRSPLASAGVAGRGPGSGSCAAVPRERGSDRGAAGSALRRGRRPAKTVRQRRAREVRPVRERRPCGSLRTARPARRSHRRAPSARRQLELKSETDLTSQGHWGRTEKPQKRQNPCGVTSRDGRSSRRCDGPFGRPRWFCLCWGN